MALTYLYINNPGAGAITGSIKGMAFTYLYIYAPGAGAITGSITGMALTYLHIYNPGAGLLRLNNRYGIDISPRLQPRCRRYCV
jgi:stage V sporulation protein SpoVS